MSPERIAELRALCNAKVTPGPWEAHGDSVIASHPTNLDQAPVVHTDGFWFPREAGANARFIAAARTALPELLDEIERLRGALSETQELQ